jgi:acetyl esterase/lipase
MQLLRANSVLPGCKQRSAHTRSTTLAPAIMFLTMLCSGLATAQVRLETVLPIATDPALSGWLGAHGTAFDSIADQRGELLIYMHGQGGTGTGANELLRTAAQAGYHAVGVTYPNDWSPFSICSGSSDPECAEKIRREIIDGQDRTGSITVTRTNSFENRLIKLLKHMDARYPTEGWATYLEPGTDNIRWNRIAVWGHSQGGGNAGVLARHQVLARVCLSAPASDGSANSPASWWAGQASPSGSYFGFCHAQDALNAKVALWNALGMGAFGAVVDVAGAQPPYGGTHQLSSTLPPQVAGQFHNSVVLDAVTPRLTDGTPAYKAVWEYMLTAPIGEGSSPAPSLNDAVFATVPTTTGSTQLMLDVHGATTGTGPRPVLVWIHGGGWQSGSHNQTPTFALGLRSLGITVISIGYRLSDQAAFPAQIHDCKGAIRWLRANAATLQIDPSRIGVWGSSAGGHLAALVATSGNVPTLEGTTGGNSNFSSAVIAGSAYFPPTDILQMQPDCLLLPTSCSSDHDASTSAESKMLGIANPGQGVGWLRSNISNPADPFPELVARANSANPITHLDSSDPVMYVAHGDNDRIVPINQSVRLRDAASAVGVPLIFEVAVGFGHGSVGDAINARAAAWMADQLLNATPNSCAPCPADFDQDGGVDGSDVQAFFTQWSTSTPCADVNQDGGTDGADVEFFFVQWSSGGC